MADKNEPDQVFELSTTAERPIFRIDAEAYHFRTFSDLGLAESVFVVKAGEEMQRMREIVDGRNEEELDHLIKTLDQAVRMLVYDAPDEIIDKLTDTQKVSLLQAFTDAVDLPGADTRQENSVDQ